MKKENNIENQKMIIDFDDPEACKYCFCCVDDGYSKICRAKTWATVKGNEFYELIEDDSIKPDWCPAILLPQKQELSQIRATDLPGIKSDLTRRNLFISGWNAYRREILGGDEE